MVLFIHHSIIFLCLIAIFSGHGTLGLVCPDIPVRDSNFVYSPPASCQQFLHDSGINAKNLFHAHAHHEPVCGIGKETCACRRARRDVGIIQVEKFATHFSNVGVYSNLTEYEMTECKDLCADIYYAVLQSDDPRACACVNLRGCTFQERNFTVSGVLSKPTSAILVIPSDFVSQPYLVDCNYPGKYTNNVLSTMIRCERLGLAIKYTRPAQCDKMGMECFYDSKMKTWRYGCKTGKFWQEAPEKPCKECTRCEEHEYVASHCKPTRDTDCKKIKHDTALVHWQPGSCPSAGLYYDARTQECKRCPSNKYALNSTCVLCLENFDSKHVLTGDTCTPCSSSFYRGTHDLECIPCKPGEERPLENPLCTKCKPHFVNPGGYAQCVECSAVERSEENTCQPCGHGKLWMHEQRVCDFCPSPQVLVHGTCRTCTIYANHRCPIGQYLDGCTNPANKPCTCGCRPCDNLQTDITGTCHDSLLCKDLSHYYNATLGRCTQRKSLHLVVARSAINQTTFDIRNQSTQKVMFCKDLFAKETLRWIYQEHRIQFADGTSTNTKRMKDTTLLATLPHQLEINFFLQHDHCSVQCVVGSAWLQIGHSTYQCVLLSDQFDVTEQCTLNVSNAHDARFFNLPLIE
jgi:hypothetical protein